MIQRLLSSILVLATLMALPIVSGTAAADCVVGSTPAAGSLVVSGTRAYTVAGGTFSVIDVSNPSAPTTIGTLSLPASVQSGYLAVQGSYVYVRASNSVFYVIGVSNPSAPTVAGSLAVAYTGEMVVAGSYAYLGFGGILIINISNPSAPALAGQYTFHGGGNNIAVSGSYAYVASDLSSIAVFNVSNPSSPALVGWANENATSLAVSGSHLCLVNPYDGVLEMLDISNPVSPVLVGSVGGMGTVFNVDVLGQIAYVQRSDRLYLVDISQPTSPNKLGSFGIDSGSMDAYGSYLYLTGAGVLSIRPTDCLFSIIGVGPDPKSVLTTLMRGFPNPFGSDNLTIPFTLARPGWAQLRILDISGRQVRLLMSQEREAGDNDVLWDGRDDRGVVVPAGVYVYDLVTAGFHGARRIVKIN